MWPGLPQELVDYIFEFLWDDKRTVFNVSLMCRRCRKSRACIRILSRSSTLEVWSRHVLQDVSSTMCAKRTRRFYERTSTLDMTEDPQSPFSHAVPLYIVPLHLPGLRTISLHGISWATGRIHMNRFSRLARFRSITVLTLFYCHFHSSRDLFRLTNALPGLEDFFFCNVSCGTPATGELLSLSKRQTLKTLHLSATFEEDVHKSYDDLGRAFIVCAGYATLQELQIVTDWDDSLFRFVGCSPALTKLTLR